MVNQHLRGKVGYDFAVIATGTNAMKECYEDTKVLEKVHEPPAGSEYGNQRNDKRGRGGGENNFRGGRGYQNGYHDGPGQGRGYHGGKQSKRHHGGYGDQWHYPPHPDYGNSGGSGWGRGGGYSDYYGERGFGGGYARGRY
jgi:hypothetical protein